ncbi:Major facilitator superfamily multidrug transporter mdrA [Psilocybe cubensis]|uniref:Major facilitator superfamily multidrug transporter mdrA n=1 Tax=Psilocybe cubensis TaxID=181762 RepID=A0ACB8H7U3_PSICU|nr:Major facilitator superfamily multidrug transporter mdrA [Psilocybe cubensis]KAH9483779.1 Major facilitator superfamily multidrug transporter mdrA [Psilocybe cubensis]
MTDSPIPFSEKSSPPPAEERTYLGSGTADDPYVVEWDLNDPEDPYNWPKFKKWVITAQLALSTFTVSFSSSSYSGGLQHTMQDLGISYNVAILGISLYVLGFALGPLIFASMGEMFGRRIVFLVTLSLYTAFQLEGALGRNLGTLLSCRLLTGIFGSSPLTNAGGAVSDVWNFRERGLASAIYSAVPFLGPVIGPIVGGFVVQNPHLGWHFNFWLMFAFSAITLIAGYLWTPETYAPVLLRWRAQKFSRASNGTIYYVSTYDLNQSTSFGQVMRTNLSRPFVFLVTEPIVFLLAIYASIVYGTLYALFSGFPIVFQEHRHFSPGENGLAFLGIGFGITMGLASQSIQNRIYWRSMDKSETGRAPPEARLHMAILGAVLTPIGLWMFAWTSQPSIPWIVPILAGIPFGTGISQILQSLTTYLMDAYGVYFASAIAATVVLRSTCGAVFPLFSPTMFDALGDQWAMSVFACLSTACMPIPLLFWKYGWWIRKRSRFAYKESESDETGVQAESRRAGSTTFSSETHIEETVCDRDLTTPTTSGAQSPTLHKKTLTVETVVIPKVNADANAVTKTETIGP